MISIQNSLDMTRAEREEALREVLALGFCPGGGAGAAELAAAVQAARAGSLPQFLFLFEGGAAARVLLLHRGTGGVQPCAALVGGAQRG